MNDRITETKEEARQGETTAPMGKVMLISTVLAFVALIAIMFAFVF